MRASSNQRTAAVLGLVLGRSLLQGVAVTGAAQTADEAEGSTEA